MGVNGLWQVVSPCARPTNLATLNRKRLAVDASIWIYQFLKAVRDKEGNALRNSHVVGFFRRICKLLWFGIKPVFVFDGGAPALKRATLQGRRRRREGRREDAVRTAGKLLAVQMQRIVEEEEDKRKRRVVEQREQQAGGSTYVDEQVEVIPSAENLVYAEEVEMSQQERERARRFHKKDAYHLPELPGGSLEGMGRPDDPRIMTIEELEEYARQFNNGENINLYDFSKIDFDGEFFKSLPPADRYNILNAARLRSRLRMGLSKEQLDGMFPDRMAFSRFQIERVKERNHLTQRLMFEVGMTGTDLTMGINARIAGEKNREYILVKNEGAEGGWALGVVSIEKDRGQIHKPIDVDALQFQYQSKAEGADDDWEDDEDFEDVPIEGLNRLPKLDGRAHVLRSAQELREEDTEMEESMFVGGDEAVDEASRPASPEATLLADENEDLNRAIAMSLKTQHGVVSGGDEEDEFEFEDVPAPEWTQKAVEAPKPITTASGRMVAHVVNNRSNAAVPRRRDSDSSDSDMDLQSALAAARRKKKAIPPASAQTLPPRPNVKNPFDGPLPFEALNWRSTTSRAKAPEAADKQTEGHEAALESEEEELEGGFEKDATEAPRPLAPWMVDDSDIRESVKRQQVLEDEMNAEDLEMVREEEQAFRRRQQDAVVEIESSDENDSDIELIEAPSDDSGKALRLVTEDDQMFDFVHQDKGKLSDGIIHIEEWTSTKEPSRLASPTDDTGASPEESPSSEVDFEDVDLPETDEVTILEDTTHHEGSGRPALESVNLFDDESNLITENAVHSGDSPQPEFEDVAPPIAQQDRVEGIADTSGNDDLFSDGDAEFDDFSDPEEEELLNQMAEEAQEHARFASTLNNKTERENQDSYERELRQLRTQQKKDRRDADEVTQIMVTECQSLLRLFGIPYITAPMEAEAQCAELVQLNLVDGIVTDDSDTFLFGGTRVYKNMFNSNKFVECYLGSDLEKELSLSREQLISLAQLLGSDYTEGLPGVGPVTAVEILSEFPGRDGLVKFKEWWQDVQVHNRPRDADSGSAFRRKFRKSQATRLFLPTGFPNPAVPEAYLQPEVDKDTEPFQWGVPDLEGLRDFLMQTIGWSRARTDEVLVPVIKDMNRRDAEGTQSNITRFFGGSVGVGAREAFAPRQIQQRGKGSKRMTEAVNKLRAKVVADSLGGEATPNAVIAEQQGDDDDNESSSRPRARASRKRKARAAGANYSDDTSGIIDDDEENQGGEAAPSGNGVSVTDNRARSKGKKTKASG